MCDTGEQSRNVYEDTNEKIERLTEWFIYSLLASVFLYMIPILIYAIVNYYILNLGENSFFLVVPTWLVFDYKEKLGF